MSLSILNSVSSLTAENALSSTQSALQKTLNRLSTGLKINSGSDDAAGLSIVTGMQANIAALTQSQQNASNGIGMLQTADGALSQVNTLLNRAVTLATEASNTGITDTQADALNDEFQSILSEINQIGQTTNFNGQNVFSNNTVTSFSSTQAGLTADSLLANGDKVTISDSSTGGTFVFESDGTKKISDLTAAITAAVTAGTLSANVKGVIDSGKFVISENAADSGIIVSTNSTMMGTMNATTDSLNTATVYIGDGKATGADNTTISTQIKTLSATDLNLDATVLTGTTKAQEALTAITKAIDDVSAQRGNIGASVNRLSAANNNMSNTVSNLQSAVNSLANADIGKTVADMTQYNVLQSTGMSALQQSNQAQQAILKLIQ